MKKYRIAFVPDSGYGQVVHQADALKMEGIDVAIFKTKNVPTMIVKMAHVLFIEEIPESKM